MHAHGLSPRAFGSMVRRLILEARWMGPFAVLLFYFLQTIIPFPTAGLAVLSGALYGPFWGSVLALLGLNASGYVSFFLGRFFGRHFVAEREKGIFKRIDDALTTSKGFLTVFFLRIFMFPFDFASLACGMTKMTLRNYFLGTFLGIIPGTLTFVWLGESFREPRSLRVFIVLFIVVLVAAIWLRRSPWAQKTIFVSPAKKPSLFETD